MISLRKYNLEVEQLIEEGQYDEAVAHCKHILLQYPKCIDTYRILGKALLELKKYSEASDIFLRVLGVFPDDFISHVGLSIICESQNDLDLAISHMERAFDVQPSNLAIQEELKRLFGKRDGDQPSKIRLTRGALIRMYARGDLYQQAITETKTVLLDDPKRFDLEVMLAKMLFYSGEISEAKTISYQVIEKIPYCFEANQILEHILFLDGDVEGSAVFNNRLTQLDPYYKYSGTLFEERDSEENSILLGKKEYTPSENQDFQKPVWLTEDPLSQFEKDMNNSDWLNNLQEESFQGNLDEISNNEISNFKSVKLERNDIPEDLIDMKMINGQISSSEQDIEKSFEITDLKDFIELKDDEVSSNEKTNNNDGVTELDFLNQLGQSDSESHSEVTNEDLASLFSELKEGNMDNENKTNSEESNDNNSMDWLSQFKSDENAIESASPEIPEWLGEFANPTAKSNDQSDDMPDWLRNLQVEADSTFPSETSDRIDEVLDQAINKTDLSDSSTESQFEFVDSDESKLPKENENSDGWEKVLLTENSSSELSIDKDNQSIDKKPDVASEDTLPDWVRSAFLNEDTINNQSPVTIPQTDKLPELDERSDEITSNVPVNGIFSNNDDSEGVISQQTNDELLDWLRGLKDEEDNKGNTQVESSLNVQNNSNPIENLQSKNHEIYSTSDVLPTDLFTQEEVTLEKEILTPEEPLVSSKDLNEFDASSINNENNNINNTILKNEPEVHDYMNPDENQDFLSEEINSGPVLSENPTDLINFSSEQLIIDSQNLDLVDLLKQKAYDRLPEIFNARLDSGQELDQILNELESFDKDNKNDATYWQAIGDILAQNNQFSKALSAYQKAEIILVNQINS